MAASQRNEVVQRLRRTVLLRDGSGLTDGQLLGCYIEHREEAAFAVLVRRHGPMVWSVCRRLLNPHDAEDAFQATFLVLVRKSASIAPRERVANWLYGVAHQTALQVRRTAARRRAKEKQVPQMPEPAVMEQDHWRDLQPLLDQELSRLPEAYREVIILSDLEGKTRREIARQLDLPEGTVGSRLARARTMLAKRLSRRGVALSSGTLAAVLSQPAVSAGLPNSVVDSTIEAATLVAAGQAAATGAISPSVTLLTEGVLKSMLLNKLKVATAVLLVVLLCVCGSTMAVLQTAAGRQATPTEKQDEKPLADKKDEKPKTDKERLQGTWVFVSAAQGNETKRKEDLQKEDAQWKTISFDGDKVRFVNVNTGGKEVEFSGRFKLNPSRKPKTIDLTEVNGETKGETVLGLYELDGDVLKLCFWSQEPRPRELDAKEEVVRKYVLTFKRAMK